MIPERLFMSKVEFWFYMIYYIPTVRADINCRREIQIRIQTILSPFVVLPTVWPKKWNREQTTMNYVGVSYLSHHTPAALLKRVKPLIEITKELPIDSTVLLTKLKA